MKRRTAFKTSLALLALCSALSLGSSLAWFSPSADIGNNGGTKDLPIDGSTISSYFAYGDGQPYQEDENGKIIHQPYGIKIQRHLYNLAWLQYLGMFNFDTTQQYFELADNVDMDGWIIPPIGTEDKPFLGHFDGKGYVISNLKVSNNFDSYNTHPEIVDGWDSDNPQPHIIGLFGVVGNYNTKIPTSSYNSATNSFMNTGITGAEIETVVKDSLIGIAAGYVDAGMKNIVVDDSEININTGSLAPTAYTPTGSTQPITSNVSDYSLVGYTTKEKSVKKASKTLYAINSDSEIEFNATEDGNSAGWGGSIDMQSVLTRLQTIRDGRGSWNNTIAYRTRVDYLAGTTNGNETSVNTSSDRTKIIADTNHEEWGHFNFIQESNYRSDYALMGGGHYRINRYNEYYQSAKISTDSSHYLSVTVSGNGNGNQTISISNATSENDASTWTVPSGTQGKISISARVGNNTQTYYLVANNNRTLSLTTTQNSGTTFRRSEASNGKTRFLYNDAYLDYDNGWKMIQIVGAPEPPDRPVPPVPPESPILPPVPVRPSQYDFYYSDFSECQIVDSGSYLTYNGSGNATFSSTESEFLWSFSNEPSNGGTTQIYTTINGTPYYLAVDGNGESASISFSTTQANATSFSVSESSGLYYFYSTNTVSGSGCAGDTTYYLYLRNNNGTLDINISESNSYATYGTGFSIQPTEKLDETAYSSAMSEYETALEEYQAIVEQHELDMEVYNEEYDEYLQAVEVYENTTYPAYLVRLDAFLASSTAFDESTHKLTVVGSLTNNQYTDHEEGAMYYGDQNGATDVTYFPLTTVDNTSNFNPADNNTAYVVAGSSITANNSYGSDRTNVRFSKAYNISLFSSDYSSSTGKFSHIYTVNDDMQREDIVNNETDYVKLKNAKETLGNLMKGQTKSYGLHFMESTISKDAITTAKYVKFNGEAHQNYQLPVNSIDFHLKEFGYINFIAATYFNTGNGGASNNDSFFSLYQIERNSDGTISRILEIKNVYQHSSRAKNFSYVYELYDGENTFYTKPYKTLDSEGNKAWLYDSETEWSENQYLSYLPQSYAKVFNVNRIKKNSIASNQFNNHVFFFEIPMNDGEFCLGSVEGGTGAYLLYLDIGANAAKTNRTVFYENYTFVETVVSYPLGVCLQVLPTIENIKPGQTIVPIATSTSELDYSDSVCVSAKPATSGYSVEVDRTGNSVALTRSQYANAPPVYSGDAITSIKDGSTDVDVVPLLSTTTNIKRMQYYDYMINTDSLIVTTFTDTTVTDDLTNSVTSQRTIVQSKYSGTVVDESKLKARYSYDSSLSTDQTDILNSMKVYRHTANPRDTNNGKRYTSDELISTTILPIPDDKLSATKVLTIKLLQDGGSYQHDVVLRVTIDNNITSGVYYVYESYLIYIVATDEDVTVVVSYFDGSNEIVGNVIYIGDNDTNYLVTGTDQANIVIEP